MEGSMTGRRRRWARFLGRAALTAGVFALALTAATCGGDDDDSSSGHPTTTESREAAVKADYLAFADMGARLLKAPDEADPEIATRTTGSAMSDLIASLKALRTAGLRYELGPDYAHHVQSVDLNGDKATLDVCIVDDSKQVEAATGKVTAEGTTTVQWTVEMRKKNQYWLVEKVTEESVQQGVRRCD
jgi:hypothetical protein